MEIKIDTNKDSVESLQQVQKILKNKAKQERTIERPKKQTKEYLTGAEEFLASKYRCFIVRTLYKLGQREILQTEEYITYTWDARKELRKDAKEELIIDQVSLFKEFVKFTSNFNFPNVDPYIFQNALKDIVDKPLYEPVCMYIEKIKLGHKSLLRVIF